MADGRRKQRRDALTETGQLRRIDALEAVAGSARARRKLTALAKRLPSADRLTREVLEDRYLMREQSISEIAHEIGCTPRDVVAHLKAHGFPLRPRLPARPAPLSRPRRPKG